MKNKVTDKQIDEIHTAIDVLMKCGCWNVLNEMFTGLDLKVWRTDIDILLSYATASLSGKKNIPARESFINTCKRIHPDIELWKGLD
jgi:hypothetical protein